jgi:hypothetical protein
MKRSLILLLALAIGLVPGTCQADDAALQACVDIYKNSTRDYSEAQQNNVELVRSFSSFCKKDGSVNTSATGVGLEAIVKAIPFKFSFNNGTSEQKMEEFCKVGSNQFDSWSAASNASSVVVTGALANFNSCVDLARSGLHLRVAINQPDTLVVSGSADGAYKDFINSIVYDDSTMTCKSADFNSTHKSVAYSGPVHLSTANPFAITCIKKPQKKQDGSMFYQRTTLTIAAGAVSPLAIVFPSDTLNGFELASQASQAVTQAVADLNQAQAATAAQKQVAETLQNRINGISVEVHAYDLVRNSCFGTGGDWGRGFGTVVAQTCGNRIHNSATQLAPGGTCGIGAVALACVNIP